MVNEIDAIRVYCEKYLESHPENYVGLLAMGGKNPGSMSDCKHQLLVLLAAVNNNDNTRMLDLCGNQLNGSSITPLVGQGETSLYAVYLLQGEYLQKAKNQCDKVHGDSNVAIGYFFRKQIRFEGRERYRVGDRRKLREWDIGKDIPLDDYDDAGKDRYWDRGDRYGRKRDYRVCDEGRERYRVGDRRKLKRDDDAGKERYWDRGDSFHDLKPDEGNDDTRNWKRKRDDRGHDDGRERYRDRGDRYGRKRDYKGHDEGRERYRVGDEIGILGKIYLLIDNDAGKEIYWDRGDKYCQKRDSRVRDEGRERYRARDRGKLIRDDDAGKERYCDRGDSFHDLKPAGGNDDTWNRKRK
ncbi:hypothetical protein CTI12_AA122970 [Artemisia annua]|uniref:Uncharacterized protein n=1 Tax=Artemisia annua TaxID=35608 RepID=A0A2U1NIS1_ARTAN|nr:hypothetical protein CTI12_AA122970 [Artemisia annua]